MFNETLILPGSSIFISDIGPQPAKRSNPGSTLVCVTTNINTGCCRKKDKNESISYTGAEGDWRYPNRTKVPRAIESSTVDLARYGYTQQVRLAKVASGSVPPLGVYTCEVPESSTGVLHNASITIHYRKQQITLSKYIVYITNYKLLPHNDLK